MSTEVNVWDESFAAFGDMRSNQFYMVEFKASKVVQKCSAVTAVACGILQNNPNSGETAVVRLLGKSKDVTAAAITYGLLIGPAAGGQAVSKTVGSDTTNYVIAQAIQTSASGDVSMCVIKGNPMRAT